MDRRNSLTISNVGRITLKTVQSTVGGWTWDGTTLRHTTGKTLRFNAERGAAISAAVAGLAPKPVHEYKYGYQIAENDREGWEFCGVADDAFPRYARTTGEVQIVHVPFAKEEML